MLVIVTTVFINPRRVGPTGYSGRLLCMSVSVCINSVQIHREDLCNAVEVTKPVIL